MSGQGIRRFHVPVTDGSSGEPGAAWSAIQWLAPGAVRISTDPPLLASPGGPHDLDMTRPGPNLPGYHIIGTLFEGARSIVYRGIRTQDGVPVVIKMVRPDSGDARSREQLEREHETASRLDTPAAIKTYGLEGSNQFPALILEDFGGESLDRVGGGTAMEPGAFLPLAIRIVSAVAELHKRRLVHKDLKPANLLVHAKTGEVKIADFSNAIFLASEQEAPDASSPIEGTLSHLSPEQTGRMNRTIDSRSDLYSLGVTFYQLLTGRLPFEGSDPLEWIHLHVASVPTPPAQREPRVPQVLSDIVMKLLSKMPEERYQSATGLRLDLERCLGQWRSTGTLQPFPLAEADVSERFQIPQKLYGREQPLARLVEVFEQVARSGGPHLTLVHGYPGIGKSSLLSELQKPVAARRGFFVSGKFDQYKRGIPYFTLAEAFRQLVQRLLGEPDEQLLAWKGKLQQALGPNGRLITDVIPEVELILGEQPAPPELGPTESRNRFHLTFRKFLQVFAGPDHPLAMFLDDMQWADGATLDLMEDILTGEGVRYVNLLLAYRDAEVDTTHPFQLALDSLREGGASVTDIPLGPLALEDVTQLVSDTLHRSRTDAEPLAWLLLAKTEGNPFFISELLKSLHQQGLLALDSEAHRWTWEQSRIEAAPIAENVVELMLGRMRRLAPATQRVLQLAAAIGNRFDLKTLAIVGEKTEAGTLADLGEGVAEGLILPLGEQQLGTSAVRSYRFLHDRIQQTAWSLIDEAERKALHLRIGRLLLESLSPGAVEERVFDLVTQLNQGLELVHDPEERTRIASLNLLAGQKARASTAYAPALRHFVQATELLTPASWDTHSALAFDAFLARGECAYLAGQFTDAERCFTSVIEHCRSGLDQARVYTLWLRLYQISGRFRDGVALGTRALALLDVSLPETPEDISRSIEAERRQVEARLGGRQISELVDLPAMRDPTARAILDLLVAMGPITYLGRPELFPLVTLKGVSLSLRFGNTGESCFAYSMYAMLLVSQLGDIAAGYAFSEMSLRLNEKLDDPRLRGVVLHIHANHINVFKNPYSTSLPFVDRALRACVDTGDFINSNYAAFQAVWLLFERGMQLDELRRSSDKYLAFAGQSRNEAVYQTIRLEQQFFAALQGTTRGPGLFSDESFDEDRVLVTIEAAGLSSGMLFHQVAKLVTHFLYGRAREALCVDEAARAQLEAGTALPVDVSFHFYRGLALAAVYTEAPESERPAMLETLSRYERKLGFWAASCPANFLARHTLLSAELARLAGDEARALRLYEQAIRGAQDAGALHDEAVALELQARFLETGGMSSLASLCFVKARDAYARWGATGKVRQLEQQRPEFFSGSHPRLSSAHSTFRAQPEQLALMTALKASQTLSGEIVFPRLTQTLMRLVLEHTGAQRGCLILITERGLEVQSEDSLASGQAEAVREASGPAFPESVVHFVRRTSERLVIADATAPHRFLADPYLGRERPRSVLCMPITRHGKMLGLLYLENKLVPGAFSAEQLSVLDLLAAQTAISLENARLYTEAQETRRAREETARMAHLQSVTAALTSAMTIEQVADIAVSRMRDFVQASSAVMSLLSKDGRELHLVSCQGTSPAGIERLRVLPLEDPLPMAVTVRTGEPLWLESREEVSSACSQLDALMPPGEETHAAVALPLWFEKKVIGGIGFRLRRPRRFDALDREHLLTLAHLCAQAIERARLYESERAARAEAEAAMAQLARTLRFNELFAGVLGHDLRNPLASIMASAQLVLRKDESDTFARPMRRILTSGDRMARMIEQLLDFTRARIGGGLTLNLQRVDLAALCGQALAELDEAHPEWTFRLEPAGDVMGLWDRDRLLQVVSNLAGNAVKHGSPEEPLLVRMDGTAAESVVLEVRNKGSVPSELLPVLFDPFRGSQQKRDRSEGLGLGLYITQQVVLAHGGKIEVESSERDGTRFIVQLPRQPTSHTEPVFSKGLS